MTEALKDMVKAEILQGKTTYRAVQVVSPGKWELTSKPVVDPPFGHVRIRVERCGVCHSDAATEMDCSRLSGRAFPATRWWAESMLELRTR